MSELKTYFRYCKYLLIILLMSNIYSCKMHDKLVYFNNKTNADTLQASSNFTFKSGDIISIHVSSLDMEAVKPFNADFGIKASPDGYTSGNAAREGFLINNNGEINFPVLGKLKIGSLSREDAENLLINRLKEYVDDPIVNIRVLNFKVSVLGSVTHPGTFTVPNERISIFEALGLAGDLKITGVRKNVTIIREENGIKRELVLDLTSASVFTSSGYYLQQNDIVYVEPNGSERFSSSLFKSTGTLIFSVLSVIVSTYLLIVSN